MFSLRSFFRHLGVLVTGVATAGQPSARLYINYSLKPPPQDLLACPLTILDPHAVADLRPGQAKGNRFLAYLSLVELARGSPSDAEAGKQHVPFIATNEAWASRLMDVTSPEWRNLVMDRMAVTAFSKGFDGLFLDTVDSVANPAFKNKAQARKALVEVILALHKRWPQAQLVMNRGFDLLPEVASVLNGLLVESVFQGFDPSTKHFQPVNEDGTRWLLSRIREAQERKLQVYVVDYVSPSEQTLAETTAKRILALGCVPLITTPALNGVVVAPPLMIKAR